MFNKQDIKQISVKEKFFIKNSDKIPCLKPFSINTDRNLWVRIMKNSA